MLPVKLRAKKLLNEYKEKIGTLQGETLHIIAMEIFEISSSFHTSNL